MKVLYIIFFGTALNGFDLDEYANERINHFRQEARKKEFAKNGVALIGSALACVGCVSCMPCCACSTALASLSLYLRAKEEGRQNNAKHDFFSLFKIRAHNHVLKKYGISRSINLNKENLDAFSTLQSYDFKNHKRLERALNKDYEHANSLLGIVLVLGGFVAMPSIGWPNFMYCIPPLVSYFQNRMGRLNDISETRNALYILKNV